MDKNLKFEEYNAYYYRLVQIGKAMIALYDCKPLNNEQIELLAMSSDRDKLAGIDIVMKNRLVLNKNYNTYVRNVDAIKARTILRLSRGRRIYNGKNK